MAQTSGRPRTPSGAAPPVPTNLPPIPETQNRPLVKEAPRRSSLGLLLRRSKSGDLGPKGSKKHQAALREQELLRQQRALANKMPPTLPILYNGAAPPQLQSFGGDDRPDSVAIMSGRTSGTYRTSAEPGRASYASVPIPPIPKNGFGEPVDPYARTESMTHRGRYSYASSAISTINSPRRVRRRKDPTPFNILIIGAQNCGKTSFLDFLKSSLTLPKKRGAKPEAQDDVFAPQSTITGSFVSHYLETEIDGERIGLTLWDSEGLEKNVVDLQLRDMSAFLESKFEETFNEEMKVVRAPGVQDTHIHCAFLLLDPARIDKNIATVKARTSSSKGVTGKYAPASTAKIIGGLDEDLDLQVLKTLQGKTTVVPVISKADSITTAHMSYLKRTVWDSLRKANLDPLEALGLDDSRDGRIDEEDEDEYDSSEESVLDGPAPTKTVQSPDSSASPPSVASNTSPESKRLSRSGSIQEHKRQMSTSAETEMVNSTETPYLPLSIISPDIYEPEIIGRKFPWGFADPYDTDHCDFQRLKEAVFTEWRGELREASRELWYERWRTSRLEPRGSSGRKR